MPAGPIRALALGRCSLPPAPEGEVTGFEVQERPGQDRGCSDNRKQQPAPWCFGALWRTHFPGVDALRARELLGNEHYTKCVFFGSSLLQFLVEEFRWCGAAFAAGRNQRPLILA